MVEVAPSGDKYGLARQAIPEPFGYDPRHMVDAIRLARRQLGLWMVTPAVLSWAGLFGYQWAFSLSYNGAMPTVFNYFSGVLGDGILIPAANVFAYSLLRQMRPVIRWQRLPLYAALGFITAYAAFIAAGWTRRRQLVDAGSLPVELCRPDPLLRAVGGGLVSLRGICRRDEQLVNPAQRLGGLAIVLDGVVVDGPVRAVSGDGRREVHAPLARVDGAYVPK